jgi:hypothetical protein
VLIQLSGLEAGSLTRVTTLPGVLAVDQGPAPGGDPGSRFGPVQVVVLAAESDAVLRKLLSWDGVHVGAVRPEPEAVHTGPEAGQ